MQYVVFDEPVELTYKTQLNFTKRELKTILSSVEGKKRTINWANPETDICWRYLMRLGLPQNTLRYCRCVGEINTDVDSSFFFLPLDA